MKALKVENLYFSYDKNSETPTISNISFEVEEGSYVSIVGPNGSGKSTLARLIIGLLRKSIGRVFIFDKELNKENVHAIRMETGIVFQNPDNQFIGATVEDDIAFGLENRNKERKEMFDNVMRFSSYVDMQDYLQKEPSNLSGGQKQRVALAGVLALEPKLLILDEATSMLDPKGKREMLELIDQIRKDNPSLAILSITHDIDEAVRSDKVIVLSDGKVAFNDTPDKIFENKEALEKLHLKLPFIVELKEAMEKYGYSTKKIENIEEAIEVLCQSK